ncbi:MAG: GtrA family protein [Clostridia bacterium]|nr:GtrA family protein [Clostridia bacterium]
MLVLIATDSESRRLAEEFRDRFELLTVTDIPVEPMDGETVLPHVRKGRAVRLKLAFAHAFNEMHADGVITLPRGGCEPAFVLRVAEALEGGAVFVDGGLHTASPARMGGAIRLLTTITTGSHRIPWCGLRGYDRSMAPILEKVDGHHDDYEITLVQAAVAEGVKITDLDCGEYEDGGAAAPHVSAKNSTRAVWGIFRNASSLKFLCSSVSSFLIDLILLMALEHILPIPNENARVAVAQSISWVVSSQYNFMINHFLVFRKKSGFWKALAQYYSLAVFVFLGKTGVLQILITIMPLVIAKTLCEAAFFLVNYFVQKKLIFNRKKKDPN